MVSPTQLCWSYNSLHLRQQIMVCDMVGGWCFVPGNVLEISIGGVSIILLLGLDSKNNQRYILVSLYIFSMRKRGHNQIYLRFKPGIGKVNCELCIIHNQVKTHSWTQTRINTLLIQLHNGSWIGQFSILTHWPLVKPYGGRDLGQHWFR